MAAKEMKVIQIAVPLSRSEIARLDEIRRTGTMKGHWVADAIREKLDRDERVRKAGAA
jgi:hypothetical protein